MDACWDPESFSCMVKIWCNFLDHNPVIPEQPDPQIHRNPVQCRQVVYPSIRCNKSVQDCSLQYILECFIKSSTKLFKWWASNTSLGRLVQINRPHRKFFWYKVCILAHFHSVIPSYAPLDLSKQILCILGVYTVQVLVDTYCIL